MCGKRQFVVLKSIFPVFLFEEKTRLENFLLHESELPSTSKRSSILCQPMHPVSFCDLLSPDKANCPNICQYQLTS